MKRWYIYVTIGLLFGVLDWYYLDWLTFGFRPFPGEPPWWIMPLKLAMNYGIWLVPIIPAVIFESRRADGIKQPILTGILTWSSAILSYYFFYGALLSLGKLPYQNYLNIFRITDGQVWEEYLRKLWYLILSQFLEWIPIAIIGGAAIGALGWWIFKPRSSKITQPST